MSFNRRRKVYIISFASILLGIIVGFILSFTISDVKSILSLSSKNYLSYLKGSADLNFIFLENFRSIFLSTIICSMLSIFVYTIPIGLLYIAYQSAVMIISMSAISQTYGFVGVLNSMLIIFPFNILIIVCLGLVIASVYSFTSLNIQSGYNLFAIREDRYIYYRLIILLLIEIFTCLILSYFVPFLFKSLIIVSF